MCAQEWLSRALIMYCFGWCYTQCALLICHMSRYSCMWRGCPPTNVLSFLAKIKKKIKKLHTWVWTHTMTKRNKQAQNQYSLPCAQAVKITKWQWQQKQHVMFVLWKKKHNILPGLRDMDTIGFVLDCHWGDLFLTRGHWIPLTA